MKVAIKNKRELRYVDAKDLEIKDGLTVHDVYEQMLTLEQSLKHLTDVVKEHHLVRKDKDYIIEVDNQLKRIKRLKLYDVPNGHVDLKLYRVVDGELIIDKNKIGGAV